MQKELRLLVLYFAAIVALAGSAAAWWIHDGNRTPWIPPVVVPETREPDGRAFLMDALRLLEAAGPDPILAPVDTAKDRRELETHYRPVFELVQQSLQRPFGPPAGPSANPESSLTPKLGDLALLYREKIRLLIEEENLNAALNAFLDLLEISQRFINSGTREEARAGISAQGTLTNTFGPEIPLLAETATREELRHWESIIDRSVPFSSILEWDATVRLHTMLSEFEAEDWRRRFVRRHLDSNPALPGREDGTARNTPLLDPLLEYWLMFRLHQGRLVANTRKTRDRALEAVELPFAEGIRHWPVPGDGPNDRLARDFADADEIWLLFLHSRAVNRLLLTALAVEKYRLTRKEYPDSSDALSPENLKRVPLDPFSSDEPLRYRKLNNGFVIYSLGPDGIDGGGETIRNEDFPQEDPGRHSLTRDSRGEITFKVTVPE